MSETASSVLLAAPAYQLGEFSEPVDSLPDLASRAAQLSMSMLPKLWGWGDYRRTALDLADLAIGTGLATLASGKLDPGSVDGLILCSTRFDGGAEVHGEFVQRIVAGLGLGNVSFYGLTLHRCANLVVALDLANTMVRAGRHRRMLVITTDRVPPGASRVESFAIFSDGAASCLVTDEPVAGTCFDLLGCASRSTLDRLGYGGEISADLAVAVNRGLLGERTPAVAELAALMHTNLVIPVVSMKERQAGFTVDQLYLDNIYRFGHCFAADPLINLVDRVALGHLQVGDRLMLAASVPGERHSVLLRCRVLAGADPAAARESVPTLAGVAR
jgi:3-oxoacyl-[acyl-carrier-protein] synthase-3